MWILLLLLPWICRGQAENGDFRNFRSLTVETGLPSNDIHCFAKGPNGYMWIGTSKGLVRYDGSEVIVFQNDPKDTTSISGNNISVLLPEGDSIMWVGTYHSGLNKLNFRTRTFQSFIPEQDQPYSIPSREIYALIHDKHGDLWIGYNRDGFGRFDRASSTFEQIKVPSLETSYSNRQNNVVLNFIIDNSDPDKIWIVTIRSLIEYNLKTGDLIRRNPYDTDPMSIEKRLLGFYQGTQSGTGEIYLACSRYGVWVFNPGENSWKNYREKVTDPKNRYVNNFNLIREMGPQTFWLGSIKRGIFVLDAEAGTILPFEDFNGQDSNGHLPINIKTWKLKSTEGYWLGTTEGVKLFNKQANQFDIYSYQPEAEWLIGRQSISAINPVNRDEILFGGYAGEGVYRYNLKTQKKTLIQPPKPIEKSQEKMFFTRDFVKINDTTFLVLTHDELYKLNLITSRLTKIKTGLKFGKDYYSFNRILKHSNGNYYISTGYSGVYSLDSSFRFSGHVGHDLENSSKSLVSSNYIYEICEDPEGMLWIGTEDGFSKWDPQENTFSNFDYQSRNDSTPTLKTIYCIKLAPDSSLWFIDAFANGVSLSYPYKQPYAFKPLLTGNEGRTDRLNNILFSRSGKTILSTETGLSVADQDGNIRRYTESEGLPAMPPLAPMVEMADGRIVIGARNELVSFYPDSLYYTPKKNELHLSSITVFDKVLNTNIDSILNKGLELDYLQNFFTFNLSLLNFDNPDEYKLSYRLKGFSNEWTATTGKNAVFTNVPGGNYIFEARLIDKNNHVAKDILTLPVEMIPPISDTWWFRLLIAIAVVGIALSFIIARFRNIRRKAAFTKELAHMEMVSLRAQMNPHFIFNSLNSIRHQIITKKNDEAEIYLVKFSRLIRWILENSETQYILLEDEIETLRLYLELESKRFDEKFDYQLIVDPSIDTKALKVPGIILQPFVENAIWHGLMQKRQSGTVVIDLRKTDINLIITITDDGIGREKAREIKSKTGLKTNSMGVKITTARLAAIEKLYNISCSTHIEDLKDEAGEARGTRVTLTLPLIHNFNTNV